MNVNFISLDNPTGHIQVPMEARVSPGQLGVAFTAGVRAWDFPVGIIPYFPRTSLEISILLLLVNLSKVKTHPPLVLGG